MPPGNANNQSIERGLDAIARAVRERNGQYWKKVVRVLSTGARTITGTSYTAIPTDNVALVLTKLSDSTDLFFTMSGAFYLTTNTGRVEYAVNINGVDTQIAVRFKNELSSHAVVHGMLALSGIPKGTYTATLKARVASGGGTWNMAVGDDLHMLACEEVLTQ